MPVGFFFSNLRPDRLLSALNTEVSIYLQGVECMEIFLHDLTLTLSHWDGTFYLTA